MKQEMRMNNKPWGLLDLLNKTVVFVSVLKVNSPGASPWMMSHIRRDVSDEKNHIGGILSLFHEGMLQSSRKK